MRRRRRRFCLTGLQLRYYFIPKVSLGYFLSVTTQLDVPNRCCIHNNVARPPRMILVRKLCHKTTQPINLSYITLCSYQESH